MRMEEAAGKQWKALTLELDGPRFKSVGCHSQVVFLHLSSLICKVAVTVPLSQGGLKQHTSVKHHGWHIIHAQ